MQNIETDHLWKEIEAAEKVRDQSLSKWDALISQIAGSDSSDAKAGEIRWPESHVTEYLSIVVPKIVQYNPRASVKSRRRVAETVLSQLKMQLAQVQQAAMMGMVDPMQAQMVGQAIGMQIQKATEANNVAKGLEHGLNKWIRDNDYCTVLDRVCYDMLIGYGVLLSSMGVKPGQDPRNPEAERWPTSARISPKRFLMDAECLHDAEARWKGHWSIEDKDDLIERAKADPQGGWLMDEIKRLATDEDGESKSNTDLNRDQVRLYELWVPDYTEKSWPGPEDGFHGAIITLGSGETHDGEGKRQVQVRKPRPYYGPRWGPYAMFGAYVEPDSPYPVSPLAASYAQIVELNAHARAMSRNAAQYKKIVLVHAENKKLLRDLKDKPDMCVVPVDGEHFDKDAVVQIEVGGVSPQQIQHYELFKQQLLNVSGLSEAQRGNAQTGVTATADSIADNASAIRLSYITEKFIRGIRVDLKSKLYYFNLDDRIRMDLGPEAGESMGMIAPVMQGGPDATGEFTPFEDYELEVDAYSMSRTSEALLQRNIMQAYQIITASAPMMVQMPWLDWRDLVRRIGDSLNLPDLADVVNFDMIQQMSQMAMQAGIGQPQQMSADGMNRQQRDQAQGQQRPAQAEAGMRAGQQRQATRV